VGAEIFTISCASPARGRVTTYPKTPNGMLIYHLVLCSNCNGFCVMVLRVTKRMSSNFIHRSMNFSRPSLGVYIHLALCPITRCVI